MIPLMAGAPLLLAAALRPACVSGGRMLRCSRRCPAPFLRSQDVIKPDEGGESVTRDASVRVNIQQHGDHPRSSKVGSATGGISLSDPTSERSRSRVRAEQDAGMSRLSAVRAVVIGDPDLQQKYVAAYTTEQRADNRPGSYR